MKGRHLSRLLAAAGIIAALVAALTAIAGTGAAAPTAAQANYAPTNTAPPTISGNPQVGQTLTANNGTWTSDTAVSYSYQWERCDSLGNNCAAIQNATAQTYVVQAADKGSTLRVVVTATNASGKSSATSAQTAVVTEAGAVSGAKVISASAADRLVIDRVSFNPGRLTSRAPFTGRFHVTDTHGVAVQDALIKVIGLPYSWSRNTTEVKTDSTGWATLTIEPTANLPLGKRAALVMFVRARTEGQNLLAGNSNRRLVQVRVR